jgi:hypothetical protein
MQIDEVVSQLITRAQTLNLTDTSTGYVDHQEIAAYVQQSLRYLANRYQLQMFVEINRAFLTTSADIESYTFPSNYGLWSPEETYRSGLSVSEIDDTSIYNLTYYDPARFNLIARQTSSTGKPVAFTIANNLIYFFPIPDRAYVIHALQRPTQEGATSVPDQYVEAVKVETLYRMAADRGRLSPVLQNERTELLMTLVNNESRQRQRFYTSRERIGRRYFR